MDNQAPP
jgi:hypothetical protein